MYSTAGCVCVCLEVGDDGQPVVLPTKRRRKKRLASQPPQSVSDMTAAARIAHDFPRHNWLENKIHQLDTGVVGGDPDPAPGQPGPRPPGPTALRRTCSSPPPAKAPTPRTETAVDGGTTRADAAAAATATGWVATLRWRQIKIICLKF